MVELALVVGCSAAAFAIAWFSDRRKNRKFITAFRKLQELLATPLRYREATDSDIHLFAGIPEASTVDASCGLTLLGDGIVQWGDQIDSVRVFVDADRTGLLYLQRAATYAESYTAELSLETKAGKRWPWALPPFKLQQTLGAQVPVPRLLAAHHEFVRGATQQPLLRFDTLAEAFRAWEQINTRTIDWRSAQDPDELLQRDLRMVAGPASTRLWARFAPQLRAEVPRARLRPRAT